MKTLQKLRPYMAGVIAILSIFRLIDGGGLDSYFYWFYSFTLLSSIITLLDCIPDSKDKETIE